MKTYLAPVTGIFLLSLQLSGAATLYVDLNNASPAPPYSSWSTAATNIQEAIDTASAGDLVLVTNGVYATGGKVMFGDLTNRVALDKPITVQSVNGPYFTMIRGNGATNGPSAVRCAWITNGATLRGFTLTAGATRTSGDPTNAASGGGVLNLGATALLANCLVISNAAANFGAGVFQGVAINSAIIGNRPNSLSRGAIEFATLINSTVVSNWSLGSYQSRHTNSIVYFNSPANYSGGTFSFSCAMPLPAGTNNISTAPQLFADGIHLQSTSPCRSAGIMLAAGTDIDGQVWGNPPSMGCDEWGDEPVIITQPRIYHDVAPAGLRISVAVAGSDPFTCYWTRNGAPIADDGHFSQSSTPDLIALEVSELDAGNYQVVVSNAFGLTTSAPVEFAIRFVNATNPAASAPFTTWNTAATNIQDAINAAEGGDLVLVTNGVYAHGGKVMAGDLTNRVAIDKPIAVRSVNGPFLTTIRGNGATNGLNAVRGAWIIDGAVLSGFTITAGATRSAGDLLTFGSGGGVWATSTNALISNCIIRSNTSTWYGSGVFRGTVRNSYVTANQSATAVGVVANANVLNCTIVSNAAPGIVTTGGFNFVAVTNSIIYYNSGPVSYGGITFASSCLAPLPFGSGNISNAPLFQADGLHLSSASPCRSAGTYLAVGSDLFGQAWANPPSMGCAEWNPAPVIVSQPMLTLTNNPCGFAINFKADGQSPIAYHWYHDGNLVTDGRITGATTTNLLVSRIRPEDVGSYWVVVSNAVGVTTSQVARLVMHYVNAAATAPMSPYTNWSIAASCIQDAIDAAQPGDVVMVTNGVYNTGGKVMSGGPTNRVVLNQAITVLSVNGYRDTVIEGSWDPVSTNGPAAVRGVWMATGEGTLVGFTVRNGATLAGSGIYSYPLHCGGGIYAHGNSHAKVYNCLLTNNVAQFYGGGAFGATLWNSLVVANVAARGYGGGIAFGELRQCTVFGNYALSGGGVYGDTSGHVFLRNSIILGNFGQGIFNDIGGTATPFSIDVANCCFSYPFSAPSLGTNNINTTFQPIAFPFVDSAGHIAINSICRGAGAVEFAAGSDMDGEAWANPPSIGADEVVEANLIGPISLTVNAWRTNTLASLMWHPLNFWDSITGRVSRIDWDFGDGVVKTNSGYIASHSWTNPGVYLVKTTAFNYDNPDGVSASVAIFVEPLIQPTLQEGSLNSNGFTFKFESQTQALYSVQYATNLVAPISWQLLQSIYYGPGGLVSITDPVLTNGSRFYRVLAR